MTTSHTPSHTSAPTGGTPRIPVTHWEELFAAGCSFRRADDKELRLLADHVLPTAGQQALSRPAVAEAYVGHSRAFDLRHLLLEPDDFQVHLTCCFSDLGPSILVHRNLVRTHIKCSRTRYETATGEGF
ncbi:hypothetical protein ACFVRU_58100, partial [Streptomyces sp. NPDC057927]